MNLYKRAFEPIQVPADMAARVERALEARTMPRAEMRRPQRLVFRLAAGLAACLLLTLGLWHLLPASEPVPSGTPGVELSNPFQPVGSPGELSAYLPFTPLLPTGLPDGWEAVSVTAISGTVGEVVYADGANRVCYRTAQGGALGAALQFLADLRIVARQHVHQQQLVAVGVGVQRLVYAGVLPPVRAFAQVH